MVAMRISPRSIVSWVRLGVIAVVVSGCATGGDLSTSSLPFNTLVPGWEYKFTLEWKAVPAADGRGVLYGHIASHYGEVASPMRLLAQSVDSSGNVIGNRIEWVQGGVPGFTSVYFEINHVKVAQSYRVTVWDYSLVYGRGKTQ
jgi:hypothetical protein